MWTANELASAVVNVLQGVLVHQWTRWGPLLSHQRQMEAWWKAELLTALNAWCWTWDLPRDFWAFAEPKPRDFGLGDTRQAPDLVVAPWSEEKNSIDYAAGPRVWIEIKERGTWWGNAAKAFGTANHGLHHDLVKWDASIWSGDDVVLACQISSHEGAWARCTEPFPPEWLAELEAIANGYHHYGSRTVAYPRWGTSKEMEQEPQAKWVQWVRMDIFRIHPPGSQSR